MDWGLIKELEGAVHSCLWSLVICEDTVFMLLENVAVTGCQSSLSSLELDSREHSEE